MAKLVPDAILFEANLRTVAKFNDDAIIRDMIGELANYHVKVEEFINNRTSLDLHGLKKQWKRL